MYFKHCKGNQLLLISLSSKFALKLDLYSFIHAWDKGIYRGSSNSHHFRVMTSGTCFHMVVATASPREVISPADIARVQPWQGKEGQTPCQLEADRRPLNPSTGTACSGTPGSEHFTKRPLCGCLCGRSQSHPAAPRKYFPCCFINTTPTPGPSGSRSWKPECWPIARSLRPFKQVTRRL